MRLAKILKPLHKDITIELWCDVNKQKPIFKGPIRNCPFYYLKLQLDEGYYIDTLNNTLVIYIIR